MTGRLLIVANRLPLTVTAGSDGPTIVPSPGGLAAGLRGAHAEAESLWFGWPGPLHRMNPPTRQAVLGRLREQRFRPVELTRAEVEGYYDRFSNGVLWPTLHYLIDRLPLRDPRWQDYVAVNSRFADAVAAEWRSGDRIWVHDYQLMLVPRLLRQRLPDARIGFFLHVPFPSSEVFRVLPWREDLLRGLLGADLIGFHTLGYLRHFATAVLRHLGVELTVDRLLFDNREVRLAALPLGIDVAAQAELAAAARAGAPSRHAARRPDVRVVLGIDRLDYTKGLLRRLLAFEVLLERRGPTAPRVQLIQVAATSRADVEQYRDFKREVDELVGRINGRFGTADFTPIRYLNRSQEPREVAALYLAADIMLVTPLRDGLNLVAKEFVATREDGDGVLIVSELAGVAVELPDALQVNPYDIEGVATALETALSMPESERRRRMAALRRAVTQHDARGWTRAFLDELDAIPPVPAQPEASLPAILSALGAAPPGRRLLCLDFDGTLVEISRRPELAAPDASLLRLLARLAEAPRTEVHIVSGRPRETLERWFGRLPLGLHAEHGGYSRPPNATAWTSTPGPEPTWMEPVTAMLRRIAARIPGALLEVKARSVAWHFREVEPAAANAVAKELRLHLIELLANLPVTVLEGNRVLEVRPQEFNKGKVLTDLLAEHDDTTCVLVCGDDRTDEDMFRVAPPDIVTVHVGAGRTAARFQLPDPASVRSLLVALLPPKDALELSA